MPSKPVPVVSIDTCTSVVKSPPTTAVPEVTADTAIVAVVVGCCALAICDADAIKITNAITRLSHLRLDILTLLGFRTMYLPNLLCLAVGHTKSIFPDTLKRIRGRCNSTKDEVKHLDTTLGSSAYTARYADRISYNRWKSQ